MDSLELLTQVCPHCPQLRARLAEFIKAMPMQNVEFFARAINNEGDTRKERICVETLQIHCQTCGGQELILTKEGAELMAVFQKRNPGIRYPF
jgi:hypothetical protein